MAVVALVLSGVVGWVLALAIWFAGADVATTTIAFFSPSILCGLLLLDRAYRSDT